MIALLNTYFIYKNLQSQSDNPKDYLTFLAQITTLADTFFKKE